MATIGEILVSIGLDTKELNQGLNKATKGLDAFAKKAQSIGKAATIGLTLPIVGAAASFVKMASDMEESLNKVDVAFKGSSKEVKKFSKTTLQSFGVSQSAALDSAALFGDMATAMGLNTSEAASMATSLVGLTGDLSSFKNIQQDVAKTALAGIFTGETESLKQLGIVMTQANLEAFALSQGITKSIKTMTEAEKVNLRYAFILEKTKNAQGDFARTSDGFANQLRILQGTFQEIGTELGTRLLPIANDLIQWAKKGLNMFRNLSPEVTKNVLAFTALAAAIGPLVFIIGSIISPIGLVITALVGGGVAIYQNWEKIVYLFEKFASDVGLSGLLDQLKQFVDLSINALGSLSTLMGNVIKLFTSTSSIVARFAKNVIANFETMFSGINDLLILFDALFRGNWSKFFSQLANIGIKAMDQFVRDIVQILVGWVPAVEEVIGRVFDMPELVKGAEVARQEIEKIKKSLEIPKFEIPVEPSTLDSFFAEASTKFEELKADFTNLFAGGGASGGGGAGDAVETPISAIQAPIDTAAMDQVYSEIDTEIEEIERRNKAYEDSRDRIIAASKEIANSVGQNLGELITGGKNLREALGGILKSVVQSMVNAAITAITAGEAIKMSWSGFGAIALAGAAAGAASAFFAGMPQFAKGGLVSGPTVGMVGEGKNISKANPEVIAPLSSLKDMLAGMMQPQQQLAMQPQKMEVTGTLRADGSDLVALIQEITGRERSIY